MGKEYRRQETEPNSCLNSVFCLLYSFLTGLSRFKLEPDLIILLSSDLTLTGAEVIEVYDWRFNWAYNRNTKVVPICQTHKFSQVVMGMLYH